MLRQGEVVADHRNLVGFAGFHHQRSGAGAVGTLQVFKDHDGHVGAFGRTQYFGGGLRPRCDGSADSENPKK